MSEKLKNDDLGYELADVATRFAAMFMDGIILSLITGLLVGAGRETGGGLAIVIHLLYYWFFWTRWEGQTPGKRAMGLRVVKLDGSRLSDTDAFIRGVGYYVSGLCMGLGFFWALFDENKRTWHDLLAGTIVIKA
jgi:uncharacterized RDD family membrane protein YckC